MATLNGMKGLLAIHASPWVRHLVMEKCPKIHVNRNKLYQIDSGRNEKVSYIRMNEITMDYVAGFPDIEAVRFGPLLYEAYTCPICNNVFEANGWLIRSKSEYYHDTCFLMAIGGLHE